MVLALFMLNNMLLLMHFPRLKNSRVSQDKSVFLSDVFPAFLGVQWRQVHEEDPDRGSLHLAGQGGHEEEGGQLAQALRQLHSDHALSATPKTWRCNRSTTGEARMY